MSWFRNLFEKKCEPYQELIRFNGLNVADWMVWRYIYNLQEKHKNHPDMFRHLGYMFDTSHGTYQYVIYGLRVCSPAAVQYFADRCPVMIEEECLSYDMDDPKFKNFRTKWITWKNGFKELTFEEIPEKGVQPGNTDEWVTCLTMPNIDLIRPIAVKRFLYSLESSMLERESVNTIDAISYKRKNLIQTQYVFGSETNPDTGFDEGFLSILSNHSEIAKLLKKTDINNLRRELEYLSNIGMTWSIPPEILGADLNNIFNE